MNYFFTCNLRLLVYSVGIIALSCSILLDKIEEETMGLQNVTFNEILLM